MFKQNETMLDRIIRIVVGALLIYVWYAAMVTGIVATIALIIGVVLLLTGVIGWCPIYTLLGIGGQRSSP